jgi:hypothetical protein
MSLLDRLNDLEKQVSVAPWKVDLDIFDYEDDPPTIEVCVEDEMVDTLIRQLTDFENPSGPTDPMWQKARESQEWTTGTFIAEIRNAARDLLDMAALFTAAATEAHYSHDDGPLKSCSRADCVQRYAVIAKLARP